MTTLVATDVAARGIHVDKVAVVVHYDMQTTDKDYQHRSGRTGRAGETGLVVAFVDESQHKDTAAIQRSLDLQCGLHTIDLASLTSKDQPDVSEPFEQRRTPGAQAKARPSRNGNGNGNGNGARQRSRTGAKSGAQSGAKTGAKTGGAAGRSRSTAGGRTEPGGSSGRVRARRGR